MTPLNIISMSWQHFTYGEWIRVLKFETARYPKIIENSFVYCETFSYF